MQVDYSVLQTIHRMLRQLTDLKDQIARCPRVEKASENILAAVDRRLIDSKQNWMTTKKAADEKQLQLRQREARVETLIGRRNASDNNKEFQLLNDQIAADKQASSVLSDEILELLERIDQIDLDVKNCKAELETAKSDHEAIRAKVKDRRATLLSELTRVEGELAAEEKKITVALLPEYRRLVAANGESALAETKGETCGNCHQVLNTHIFTQLRQRKIVICRACNSILYRSEQITTANA
jgi:predicted  nucleic acid-binding Zn-ribbon protein